MTREALYEPDDILVHYLRQRLNDVSRDNHPDRFSTQSFSTTLSGASSTVGMPDDFLAARAVKVNSTPADHALEYYADLAADQLVFPEGLQDGDTVEATAVTGEPWIRGGHTDRTLDEVGDYPAIIVNQQAVSELNAQGIGEQETRDQATFQIDILCHENLQASLDDGTEVNGSDLARELKRKVDSAIRRLKAGTGPDYCGLKLTNPTKQGETQNPFNRELQHERFILDYTFEGQNLGQP